MRLREATALLAAAGVSSPAHDAATLLAHARGVPVAQLHRAELLGHEPDAGQEARARELVEQRCARVPLQHLTGVAGFRRLELAVGPGVFVPRPETELLVELATGLAPPGGVVVDLCAGSGAIALALADERPDLRVHAVELDPMAAAWARRNVERTGLPVDLREGRAQEAFGDLAGAVDVVVSNPPYIPDGMVPTDPEVALHDPGTALYGRSEDGLALPLEVAARAAVLLTGGGAMVMEHAETQGESLPAALRRGGWQRVEDHRDLTGRPRAVVGRR